MPFGRIMIHKPSPQQWPAPGRQTRATENIVSPGLTEENIATASVANVATTELRKKKRSCWQTPHKPTQRLCMGKRLVLPGLPSRWSAGRSKPDDYKPISDRISTT
jgi:hypothetical protein